MHFGTFIVRESPKKRNPEAIITQSLKWPSTLYETGDVFPMTRNMDKLTRKARQEERATHNVTFGSH